MNTHSPNIWMYISSYSEEVTGSNTYVKIKWSSGREVKFIVDCGLFQEGKWTEYNSEKFQYAPADLDFAIATHFHTDHIGRFPYLMNEGFKGKIYTTYGSETMFPKMLNLTAEILEGDYISALNSWRKEKKARNYKNPRGKKDMPAKEGKRLKYVRVKSLDYVIPKLIFTKEDVKNLQDQVYGIPFEETFCPCEDVYVTFYRNGHMHDASVVVVTAKYGDESLNLLVTGDYAYQNKVTGIVSHVPRSVLNTIDIVLSESTYGAGPLERNTKDDYELHLTLLKDTIENSKKLVYLTNAIERPLVILSELMRIMDSESFGDKLKEIPIYFDSTFGIVGIKAYQNMLKDSLVLPENFVQITSDNRCEAIRALTSNEPAIFLFTSPQFYFGSFVNYVKYILENPNVNVLFASYISECVANIVNLPDGAKFSYKGEYYEKKCKMYKVGHFSSHASISELKRFIDKCKNKKAVLFFHGTTDAKDNIVKVFKEDNVTCYAMLRGKTVRLNSTGITKVY